MMIGFIGGGMAYVLGGWDILLWTLTAFVVLDYVTGLIRAAKMKELSSEIGFWGLVRKIMIFVLVIVANLLQQLINESIPLREIVIMFFISNEGISLLENASIFIDVPDRLKDVLLQLRDNEAKGQKTTKEEIE
ncbi:phage holin family protein [Enterococcus faecium]|uniref:phage holin family protein n=1 Tax=Enterococcus faecium TaxID=1352 RepID=UPI003217EBDC